MINHMKDLDMSNVIADAEDQFDNFLNSLLTKDDIDLQALRYKYGEDARIGEPHCLAVVSTIDWVRAGQPDPHWMGEELGFYASYNPTTGQWDPIY